MPFTPPTTVASVANTGYLATFSLGAIASPLVLTPIAEVKSINNNGVTITEVDFTHLLSPGGMEESGPGLMKPGDIDLGGNFIGDPSQTALLATYAANQTIFAWSIKASLQQGAKTYTCAGRGYVSAYKNGPFESNKAVEFAYKLKTAGAMTETVA